jgi:hypothetical protein
MIGSDNRATPHPPDSFDLTDYIMRYCILEAQSETLAEEDAAAVPEE